MVDRTNPTSQFHPYQAPDATPHSGSESMTGNTNTGSDLGGGLGNMLNKFGIDSSKFGALGNSLKNVDMKGGLDKARGMAANNGGLVLGGLAALAIGAGLMRKRSMSR